MTDPSVEPTIRPYRPFPSFATWISQTQVGPVVGRYQHQFRELRSKSTDDGRALRERATNWAAIDTGAIEGLYDVERGFTISVAANTALLQAIRSAKGESVERAVADALAAYEFVLDLATRREPVSEAAIRELHKVVVRSQDHYQVLTAVGPQQHPLPKGEYKTQDNHPLNLASNEVHGYAPVFETAPEMARLVDETRSSEFEIAPPVQQAAFVHYAFVAIHPFADGNGRVARGLASIFLYRDPGLPLVVFNDEKPQYLAALEAADDGRFQPLVSFVGERVIDTVNLLKGPQGLDLPPVEEQAAAFARELNGRSGYPHAEVDAAAARLLDVFEQRAQIAFANANFVPPISGRVERGGFGVNAPPGEFRRAPIPFPVGFVLNSAPPSAASVQVTFAVAIARGLDGDEDYLLYSSRGDRMAVFIREVLPRVTTTLELRLDALIEGTLRSAMAQLGDDARAALKQQGYS